MAPTKVNQGKTVAARPRVLVVDDEADLIGLMSDTVAPDVGCKVIGAGTVAAARRVIENQRVDVLVVDINLPDGEGLDLLGVLHLHQPTAQAIVITGRPTVDGAIEAIREGATDFVAKPFDNRQIGERVKRAIARAASAAKAEKRMDRLRDAVRRLNDARKTVSKKVDLLCNDLIGAYGELSRQFDIVRVQEGYRNVIRQAKDLEQLLCHTMDWLLRQLGYSNIAVWLAGDDDQMQLGAYMKYTIPGEQWLTDALRKGLVEVALKENFVHLSGDALVQKLSVREREALSGQDVIAVNCTYLAESLGVMLLFRDAKGGFSEEDAATIRQVTPLFAVALANIVRGADHDEQDDEPRDGGPEAPPDSAGDPGTAGPTDEGNADKPPRKKKPKKDDADWWKRGEEPPF